ncbi:unnamed protein product [Schistocephalus solidus]|uniref:PINc domain-containing protein n=1 Tax=Schistocephalus solidus TaxID=70667 RepID=A0A183TLS4_SCHSO|nr:unnamed protein product [Schistocephalus solidus]
MTPEKRRRSEQPSPEVAVCREGVKDSRVSRPPDHNLDDDAPPERSHKSRKQKRTHASPSPHHSKHRKEQRLSEKQMSIRMTSKEVQEIVGEKVKEQSRKRKHYKKHRHDSVDSEEATSKRERSLGANVDHHSRRESSSHRREKYRPPSKAQLSPEDDFGARSSSAHSEGSTRLSPPRDTPSPRRHCLERQAEPERTARFRTSVYPPASLREPKERAEKLKRQGATVGGVSPTRAVEVSREKPPKDRSDKMHRFCENKAKEKSLSTGEVQRTQPSTESPSRSFPSGACEETGSGRTSLDSFRSRHLLRPSMQKESSRRRSTKSPRVQRRSKAGDDLLSESSRDGEPQARDVNTHSSERKRHRQRDEQSRADAPCGVSKTKESPQASKNSKLIRSRSTSEHSTDPSSKLEPDAKPGVRMVTPETSSATQPHRQSSSPKKRISAAGNSGATSLLGLIDMLSVEETSDTELEALLPPTILSGEHAKLCMPSSSKQTLQQQHSKDVLGVSGHSAASDFQPVVSAGAGLDDGVSGRSETVDAPVSSDTVLDRLSTRLQAKMLTAETWLEGEDFTDEDFEAAAQPSCEEAEEDDNHQQQTVFGLVSTSATLLTPRQRLLTSLATPWQEFETAGEMGEKDLPPSSVSFVR